MDNIWGGTWVVAYDGGDNEQASNVGIGGAGIAIMGGHMNGGQQRRS